MIKLYIKFKRVVSFVLAVLLFIIFSPIMLVIIVAIRLESNGSAVFKQLRTGKNGKEFYCYKFRSMFIENDIHNFKEEDKITKVGHFIRKMSLDELPQLINIDCG